MTTASLKQVARRYVQALFSLAEEKKQLDAVAEQLELLTGLHAQSDAFQLLSVSRTISEKEQQQGVSAILDAIKASKLTRQFMDVLVKNGRLDLLPFIAEEFALMLRESRNETEAEIISARPLTKVQEKTIKQAVLKATGRADVHITELLDESILGGIIVKVDGQMVDLSLSSYMNKLTANMRAQV